MGEFCLQEKYRKIFWASFWMTPWLILVNVLIYIASLAAKDFGLDIHNKFVDFVGIGISSVTAVCIVVMLFYPMTYLYYLWQVGEKAKFVFGVLMFIFYSLVAGYLWYYQKEIKGKDIKVGWPVF